MTELAVARSRCRMQRAGEKLTRLSEEIAAVNGIQEASCADYADVDTHTSTLAHAEETVRHKCSAVVPPTTSPPISSAATHQRPRGEPHATTAHTLAHHSRSHSPLTWCCRPRSPRGRACDPRRPRRTFSSPSPPARTRRRCACETTCGSKGAAGAVPEREGEGARRAAGE